jgi:hypothetical protein
VSRFFFCLLLATFVFLGAALPFYILGVRFESYLLAAVGVVGGCMLTIALTFLMEHGVSAMFNQNRVDSSADVSVSSPGEVARFENVSALNDEIVGWQGYDDARWDLNRSYEPTNVWHNAHSNE